MRLGHSCLRRHPDAHYFHLCQPALSGKFNGERSFACLMTHAVFQKRSIVRLPVLNVKENRNCPAPSLLSHLLADRVPYHYYSFIHCCSHCQCLPKQRRSLFLRIMSKEDSSKCPVCFLQRSTRNMKDHIRRMHACDEDGATINQLNAAEELKNTMAAHTSTRHLKLERLPHRGTGALKVQLFFSAAAFSLFSRSGYGFKDARTGASTNHGICAA